MAGKSPLKETEDLWNSLYKRVNDRHGRAAAYAATRMVSQHWKDNGQGHWEPSYQVGIAYMMAQLGIVPTEPDDEYNEALQAQEIYRGLQEGR